jgi:hypothetical protein
MDAEFPLVRISSPIFAVSAHGASKSVVSCNGKPPATVIRVLQQRKRQRARVSSRRHNTAACPYGTVSTSILARQRGRPQSDVMSCRVGGARQSGEAHRDPSSLDEC